LNKMRREPVDDWGLYFTLDEEVLAIPNTSDPEEDADAIAIASSTNATAKSIKGTTRCVELIENGSNIPVTDLNKAEFIFRMTRYVMADRIQLPLSAMLHGIYQVIPPFLLSVFSAPDMELLLCGVENIDIKNWKLYTQYTNGYTGNSKVILWFWDVLENELNNEQKQRLLQYVTGTSRVPNGGFARLSSQLGASRPFTIYKSPRDDYASPRAHTCFNQLDLPAYHSREELLEAIKFVCSGENSGFTQV